MTDDDTDADPHAGKVVFEVETLTAGTFRAGYSPESATALADDLDRATTIVACPDGHAIIPVTGGVPKREMPRCGRCDQETVGVVEVSVVGVPDEDSE